MLFWLAIYALGLSAFCEWEIHLMSAWVVYPYKHIVIATWMTGVLFVGGLAFFAAGVAQLVRQSDERKKSPSGI